MDLATVNAGAGGEVNRPFTWPVGLLLGLSILANVMLVVILWRWANEQ